MKTITKPITLTPREINSILASYKDAKTRVWSSELMKNIYTGEIIAFESVLHTLGFSAEDLKDYLTPENEG